MDSLDLLAREDEFKKLNKQLEKKSESLLKAIEHAMQKQDIFAEFSHSLTLTPVHTPMRKHSCEASKTTTPELTPTKSKNSSRTLNSGRNKVKSAENSPQVVSPVASSKEIDEKSDCNDVCAKAEAKSRNDDVLSKSSSIQCFCCKQDKISEDLAFLYAFVSVSVEEKILPPSFLKDRATVEAVCKFLSTKVKLMQEQIDKMQSTLNIKASQCESHMTQLAELEGERMTLLNRMNNIKSSSADVRAKSMALQKKFDEKERLYKEQRSENDKLSSEVKRLRSKCAGAEARCATQEETIDNLKHQLEVTKRNEKDLMTSTRTLSASQSAIATRLERKIRALNTHAHTQAALVGNLRRQNALLAAGGALRGLEGEYGRVLEQE